MRNWLEGIALLVLGLHIAITVRALFGSDQLPERIPIQFDATGHPVGWGSPAMLLLLPAITLIIYLLFTVVTRFPGAFNYPVKVTVFNRVRMQNLALDMMAWLKVEIVGLLTWMQWVTVEIARDPGRYIPGMTPAALVAVFATVSVYIVMMFRVGREPHRPKALQTSYGVLRPLPRSDLQVCCLEDPQTAKQQNHCGDG
jgi:hypothetical protein